MSGEETQAKGADGARRARRWLDSTTRAEVRWVNPEKLAVKKLTFEWADGSKFSFDLAGVLRGEDIEGEEFFAECKKYKDASDQPTLYRKFLAQCYCAFIARPERCDNFIWITWAPFSAGTWSKLQESSEVRAAVLEWRKRALDETDLETAKELVDEQYCKDVADRLQIIVLSDWQQENLTLTVEHLAVIRSHRTEMEAS